MAKDIGDVLQGWPRPSASGSPPSVAGHGCRCNRLPRPQRTKAVSHGMPHDLRRDRHIEWRAVTHEHGATGTPAAIVSQVRGKGPSGQHGQRQDVDPARLPGPNADGAVPPIQIVELQGGDFTRRVSPGPPCSAPWRIRVDRSRYADQRRAGTERFRPR